MKDSLKGTLKLVLPNWCS